MKFFRKIAAGFGLATAILVFVSVTSYQSTSRLINTFNQVEHSQRVMRKLEEVLSQMKDAETGQRGYLLTGKESYLEPYNAALQVINRELKSLWKLTANRPNQQQYLAKIEPLVINKIAELNETINLRQNKGFEAALQIVQTDQGKNLMDNIRRLIREMEVEEEPLLKQRSLLVEASARNAISTLLTATFLTFFILAGVYYIIYREFAERKRVEAALRKSEERFQVFMNHSPAVAFMKDEQGHYFYVNKPFERVFNVKLEYLQSKTDFDWLPEETAKQLRENDIAVLSTGKTAEFLEIVPTPDGYARYWLAFKFPVKDVSGQNLLGGVAVDITEQKQEEAERGRLALERTQQLETQMAELERLNRLKDDFLSTVSHELRAPMANIKMALKMLELALARTIAPIKTEPEANSSSVARYLQILKDECGREITLIDDLLDLQRLEAGTQPLDLEMIHLPAWLPQLVEPFQGRAQNREQTLQLTVPADLPPLASNSASLERIVVELLNNACKYTPSGEEITLVALAQNGVMQLQVSNSGVEIPGAELPRIFNKFYRVTSTDPWKQGGTGLGLALVKKLSERLGGTISVSSEHGITCFTVELPICAHEDEYLNSSVKLP